MSVVSVGSVGSEGSSRSLRCVSVVGSVKNSILAQQSNSVAASPTDHEDSTEEDNTYMDMSAQKIEPLQGGETSRVECLH